MTRKNAIRVLMGVLAGIMMKAAQSQTGVTIPGASISFGDPIEPSEAEKAANRAAYQRCLTRQEGTYSSVCIDPDARWWTRADDLKPGTAMMTLNLDSWKYFEVTMDGKSVKLSRQEMWEALQ